MFTKWQFDFEAQVKCNEYWYFYIFQNYVCKKKYIIMQLSMFQFFLLNSAAACTQKNITRQFPHPEKIVILFPALFNGQGNLLCCSPCGL